MSNDHVEGARKILKRTPNSPEAGLIRYLMLDVSKPTPSKPVAPTPTSRASGANSPPTHIHFGKRAKLREHQARMNALVK